MFPDFNIFSVPLLLLIIQGLILVGILIKKSKSKKDDSSLILAILLFLTCYHRISYAIGFMGWYDTFRTTKINYFLISMGLCIGPLIYLYIKSIGEKGFTFDRSKWIHFLPALVYMICSIGIFLYDSRQPDFHQSQNGIITQWILENLSTFITIVFSLHLFVYLIFSFRHYYKIRSKLEHQFSNTYKFELRWLRNFLFLFAFLFVYDSLQLITINFIFDLHWTQEWWYEFFSLVVVIYVGIKGFFTPMEDLPLLEPALLYTNTHLSINPEVSSIDIQKQLAPIIKIVESEALYLDSNLTLTKLARKANIPSSQLSMIINKGKSQNFNEFINEYRVTSIKEKLMSIEFDHLSILALAFDSGFNSKATFNRVFKKMDGNSPSFYRKRSQS